MTLSDLPAIYEDFIATWTDRVAVCLHGGVIGRVLHYYRAVKYFLFFVCKKSNCVLYYVRAGIFEKRKFLFFSMGYIMDTVKTDIGTIHDAIEDLVAAYANMIPPSTREEINSGQCMDFAVDLKDMGFGTYIWGQELPRKGWGPEITDEIWNHWWYRHHRYGHCFTIYKGRYYDSESPDGVEWPEQLQCFQRFLDQECYKGMR